MLLSPARRTGGLWHPFVASLRLEAALISRAVIV
jgi:hypothetical protein